MKYISVSLTSMAIPVQYEKNHQFLLCKDFTPIPVDIIETRMHSSRIPTVLSSGHWGVYPSMHWVGVCVSQHALGNGVSAQECPSGGVCPWDLPRECLPKGVTAWGCMPRGCLLQYMLGYTPL